MTQQEEFGRRLRQLRREKSAREERDIEQGEVAAAIGDSQPNVARWERGRIPKDDATLERLAAYYGVTMPWLRFGKGERHPSRTVDPFGDGSDMGIPLAPGTAFDDEDEVPVKKRAAGGGSSSAARGKKRS